MSLQRVTLHKTQTTMKTNKMKIPRKYMRNEKLGDAYQRGFDRGSGFAACNVPRLGEEVSTEGMGKVTVDAENIREVHLDSCWAAESNNRSYSPFEFTAHEFNSDEDSESLWEAFDAGTSDAISADLAGYSDADYGING